MTFMCLGCGEVYDQWMEMCPKFGCEGNVVEIDELLVPAIRLLNKKGYFTSYCCSGHTYGDGCNAYVTLDKCVMDVLDQDDINEMTEILPLTWEIMTFDDGRIYFSHEINYRCEDGQEIERYNDIIHANIDFLNFVDKLPELEY